MQTLATLKTDLGLTGTNSGDQTSIVGISGSLAEFNAALTGADFATGGGTATGTNTGDQTTISGNAGSATILQTSRNFSIAGGGITAAAVAFDGAAAAALSASVDAGHITLARMADIATSSLIYRKTAGTGVPEVQTLATLKADLGLTGTNSGDQTITLTGNVTGSGTGSFAATIAAGAVTLAMQAQLAANSFIGNNTGSAATPLALSVAQAQALLNVANGATANSSDATLLARANHTGTQLAATISDFNSAARAQTEAELIAGANITITPAGTGATRTLTMAATGGSGVRPAAQLASCNTTMAGPLPGRRMSRSTPAISSWSRPPIRRRRPAASCSIPS